MPEAIQHPLTELLGPGWRFIARPSRATVVVLHENGLWVEFDESLWWDPTPDPSVWKAASAALVQGVQQGRTGRHTLLMTRSEIEGEVSHSVQLQDLGAQFPPGCSGTLKLSGPLVSKDVVITQGSQTREALEAEGYTVSPHYVQGFPGEG